jgi:hypothetical protein
VSAEHWQDIDFEQTFSLVCRPAPKPTPSVLDLMLCEVVARKGIKCLGCVIRLPSEQGIPACTDSYSKHQRFIASSCET